MEPLDILFAAVLFVLFIATVLDIITTNRIISKGGGEQNWLIASAMGAFGRFWFVPKIVGVFTGASCAIYIYWLGGKAQATFIVAAFCILLAVVVGSNISAIRKLEKP